MLKDGYKYLVISTVIVLMSTTFSSFFLFTFPPMYIFLVIVTLVAPVLMIIGVVKIIKYINVERKKGKKIQKSVYINTIFLGSVIMSLSIFLIKNSIYYLQFMI